MYARVSPTHKDALQFAFIWSSVEHSCCIMGKCHLSTTKKGEMYAPCLASSGVPMIPSPKLVFLESAQSLVSLQSMSAPTGRRSPKWDDLLSSSCDAFHLRYPSRRRL